MCIRDSLSYEACNLGSINLGRMVVESANGPIIDWKLLAETTRTAIRFLDNVIAVNNYPLPQISEMVQNNRKIGLGVMAVSYTHLDVYKRQGRHGGKAIFCLLCKACLLQCQDRKSLSQPPQSFEAVGNICKTRSFQKLLLRPRLSG